MKDNNMNSDINLKDEHIINNKKDIEKSINEKNKQNKNIEQIGMKNGLLLNFIHFNDVYNIEEK